MSDPTTPPSSTLIGAQPTCAMKLVFSQEPLPTDLRRPDGSSSHRPAIYLAGPTLRSRRCQHCNGSGEVFHIPGSHEKPCHRCKAVPSFREDSWRQTAIHLLSMEEYQDLVLVPEMRDWREWTAEDDANYQKQVSWELEAMEEATVLAFWVPRDMQLLPGMTTNVEWGYWIRDDASKMILGHPADAPHCRYLDELADRFDVAIVHSLSDLIDGALEMAYP